MNRFAVISLLAVAGCAPSLTPSADPGRSTTIVSDGMGTPGMMVTAYHDGEAPVYDLTASPEAVWSVLPPVYDELKIRMGTSDAANRVYGNRTLAVNRTLGGKPLSTYLSCGADAFGVPLADKYRVDMSILTTLAPVEGGKTRITTQIAATASNPSVSSATTNCASTGNLEQLIASRIQARLAAYAAGK